ncbi:hypothetical protein BG910_00425 [Neisseria chenwenguii]|uniref:K+ potassium transporter integral membrane domain-containing protein n=1 Tax=Neisseria chenwenguii TaxID=1853278 RepID=A0A220RZ05_9NEIS|nr:KUP/HAK/KT family potassium transporter [Neisseria chenwenguii]ASK26412.1 hypothetical protein BG910_00425 [Neisseria chenwenguii]ROV55835.1 hypothetical protein EGS38_07925 [Neisseria chenwenguii]
MRNENLSATATLAALDIVYGDIGTGPLYTLRESLTAARLPVDETNVLGFVSLILWALLLIVTLNMWCLFCAPTAKARAERPL